MYLGEHRNEVTHSKHTFCFPLVVPRAVGDNRDEKQSVYRARKMSAWSTVLNVVSRDGWGAGDHFQLKPLEAFSRAMIGASKGGEKDRVFQVVSKHHAQGMPSPGETGCGGG